MSHNNIFVEKGGIFWEGGVGFGECRTYKFVKKGGIFWERGVDSGKVSI